ncbi:hypothetical protein ACFYKX_07710 [Cytobacillus sp. FJAT-54145]|uniref:Uncharacterized protein n=1 Tax=Cytobacillus spartinae TaxID=3299023 RepID=A0ABW6KCJ6_9BACI
MEKDLTDQKQNGEENIMNRVNEVFNQMSKDVRNLLDENKKETK